MLARASRAVWRLRVPRSIVRSTAPLCFRSAAFKFRALPLQSLRAFSEESESVSVTNKRAAFESFDEPNIDPKLRAMLEALPFQSVSAKLVLDAIEGLRAAPSTNRATMNVLLKVCVRGRALAAEREACLREGRAHRTARAGRADAAREA